MSTDYVLEKRIEMDRLFDGTLKRFGIEEQVNNNTRQNRRLLTDGKNHMWIHGDKFVELIKRFGTNEAYDMLQILGSVFNTEVYSEYSLEYGDGDSVGAWNEIGLRDDLQFKEKSHEIVMEQIAELESLEPGSFGWVWARVVKHLVADNEDLVFPDRMDQISCKVMEHYLSGDFRSGKVSAKSLEEIKLAVTRGDELHEA